MRIAVLIKQVPVPADLRLVDGRLSRDGAALEVNAYCRRANAKAVELAGPNDEVVVFTMGPPAAADALREMLACGATRAVHAEDPSFAGADTLATARVLAEAIRQDGPFDLVLCGLNSVDADTGQVGPELAALLGLPFGPGVHRLELVAGGFRAQLETDDGYAEVEGPLPAVLSCSERLIAPSKAARSEWLAVPGSAIIRRNAKDLGLDPLLVGIAGSPTRVGVVRQEATKRQRMLCASVSEAVERLGDLGAFSSLPALAEDEVPLRRRRGGPEIWCFLEPRQDQASTILLNEAARLAWAMEGSVVAVTPGPVPAGLGALGADRLLVIPGSTEPEQWAEALGRAAAAERPWALLMEATRTGRAVAATVAAQNGWGLVGDAIGLEVQNNRLAEWKPAFGGGLAALIHNASPVQLTTIRTGAFKSLLPRHESDPTPEPLAPPSGPKMRTLAAVVTDNNRRELLAATRVVGIGGGVNPDDYPLARQFASVLGAAIAATRKVTDKGWLPRSRQVGLTGHSVAPDLYIAIGCSGTYNHAIGVRHAGFVLAIIPTPALRSSSTPTSES